MGQQGMSSAPDRPPSSTLAAFLAGFRATWTSVFSYVLFGTYIGIGALAHDFGFSVWWALASTILMWAGPAQVILISALGAGASLIEAAIAVALSSVRLLPMVVGLLPKQPRENRIAFCNGLGTGYGVTAITATVSGFHLAAKLPPLMSAALLFLTPVAFLMSTLRTSRMLIDRLSLGFGLVLGPLFAWWQVGLDLMWSGIVGGTAAYLVHRFREALQ
jgi:predicted branched-subunit amino acid permease